MLHTYSGSMHLQSSRHQQPLHTSAEGLLPTSPWMMSLPTPPTVASIALLALSRPSLASFRTFSCSQMRVEDSIYATMHVS